jgi:hypothetical protein
MLNKVNEHNRLIENKLDQIHRINDEIRKIYGLDTNHYSLSNQ